MDLCCYLATVGDVVVGGAETFARETYLRLNKNHNVHIVAGGGYMQQENILSSLQTYRFPYTGRRSSIASKVQTLIGKNHDLFWLESLTFYNNAKHHFKHHNYDVIHTHYFLDMILKRHIISPVVLSLHGYPTGNMKSRLYRKILSKYTPDLALSCSKFVQEQYNAIGIESEVLYNGVDINRFKPEKKDSTLLKKHDLEGKQVILFVGRFTQQKGLDKLIEAFCALDSDDVALVAVGDGPLRSQAEQWVMQNIDSGNVVFPGIVSIEDLPKYYNLADIFVIPSLFEPLSIVTMEAMACGKPVIASQTGGIPEVVSEKCGLFVQPGDMRELIYNLQMLLIDENLCRTLGKEGRKRAETVFSWDIITKQLEKHLVSLL